MDALATVEREIISYKRFSFWYIVYSTILSVLVAIVIGGVIGAALYAAFGDAFDVYFTFVTLCMIFFSEALSVYFVYSTLIRKYKATDIGKVPLFVTKINVAFFIAQIILPFIFYGADTFSLDTLSGYALNISVMIFIYLFLKNRTDKELLEA